MVDKLNKANAKTGVKFAINQFSDLSDEEFKKFTGLITEGDEAVIAPHEDELA